MLLFFYPAILYFLTMKKDKLLQFLALFLFVFSFYGQEPEVKNYERFEYFLTEQNEKSDQIALGQSEAEVRAIFGEAVRVKIPKVGKMKPLDQVFKQPEFKNVFKPNTENEVVVLWYFTTPLDQNGVISKRECTPVLFLADKVIGKGWDDFNKARKDGTLR